MKYLIFIFTFLVSTFFYYNLRFYVADDAYIHLRIAEHLTTSGLPYFNFDEHVNGSSSTLWIFILCLSAFFPGDPLIKLSIINGFIQTCLIFSALSLISKIGKDSPGIFKFLSALLIVIPVFVFSFQQMESSAACLFALLGLCSIINKSKWGLFYFMLSACTRPEFAILWIAFFIYKILNDKDNILFGIISSSVPAVSAAAYNLIFFKTLIPHSLEAKSKVYELTNTIFFQEITKILSLDSNFSISSLSLIAALLAALFSIRLAAKDSLNRIFYIFTVSGLLIFAAYFLRKVTIFPWYMPLIVFPVYAGLCLIALKEKAYLIYALLLYSSLPYIQAFPYIAYAGSGYPEYYPDYFRSARARQYVETSKILNSACPACSMLAPEIGGLGYGFKGSIRDAVGLVSPSALKHHPLPFPQKRFSGSVGAIPTEYVKEINPDLIVSLEIFLKDFKNSPNCNNYEFLSISPFYGNDYNILKERPLWGSHSLYLFFNKNNLSAEVISQISNAVLSIHPQVPTAFKCKT